VRRVGSLARRLPLDAPMTVNIDVCNACNFRCSFCPTGDVELLKMVGRKNAVMKLDLFKKIIDDLRQFNGKIVVVSLHKDGEPLLNRQLAEMVAYAKMAGIASSIEITTNAALLYPETASRLIDAGLDTIRISIEHVTAEGYKGITKRYANYEQIVENISYIFHEKRRRRSALQVLTKIVDTGLSESEKSKFFSDFGPISDVCRIEGIMGWSHSELKDFTLGIDPQVGMDGITTIKKHRIVCPDPFRMMAINVNGKVSVCCNDWTMRLITGDANTQSIRSIWNGPELNRIRRLHLQNRRSEVAPCANCQVMLGSTDLFDLDDERERLLQLFPPQSVN
jgi:hypothetical protein